MKTQNSKLRTFCFLLVILTFTFCLLPLRKSWAQELSVAIDPPILQIEASAPSLIKSPISITNQSDQSVTYSIFLVPFKAKPSSNGEPEFDPSLIDEYKSIFGKVQVSDENRSLTQITLAPKQKKDLTLSIRLQKGEQPRDYYFSVIFISEATAGQDQNSAIGARAGIGTNVLLSIGPKTPTRGHIEEFSAPLFATKGPVKFKLNIANESTHYVSIKGNLLIKNNFGQTVGNIDLDPTNILAGSNRFMNSEWNEKFLLGIYKADLNVALSPEGPIFKRSIWFFAFPTQAILGTILALILLAGMVKRARSKY